MKKEWRLFIKGLILLTSLVIVISLFNCCSSSKNFVSSVEPQLFTDDYDYKIKSLTFLTSVEVRVDSLIIPAKTVGKLRELVPNGRGGIDTFVFDFLAMNGAEVSLRFVRKELVEKRPINPKSFILRGKAEFYEGENYKAKKTLKPLSIPKGTECTLLFNQNVK